MHIEQKPDATKMNVPPEWTSCQSWRKEKAQMGPVRPGFIEPISHSQEVGIRFADSSVGSGMASTFAAAAAILASLVGTAALGQSPGQPPSSPSQPAAASPAPQTQPVAPPAPPAVVPADPAILDVGQPAPALAIESVLSGEIALSASGEPQGLSGKAQVLYFWASWSAPSRRTMELLTKVQAKHGSGLAIVAISGVDTRGESAERVKRMLAGIEAKPTFAIALDKGAASRAAFLRPARVSTLPAAFLVTQTGQLAWMGNPATQREDFEAAVNELMDGSFDMSRAIKRAEEQLARAAEAEQKGAALQVRLRDATRDSDAAGAIAAIDALMTLDKDRYARLSLSRLEILLAGGGGPPGGAADAAAIAYAARVAETDYPDDTPILESMAWTLVDVADVSTLSQRRLDVALLAAERANQAALGEDARALDALARVHFARGDVTKAIEFAGKAVTKGAGDPIYEQLVPRLKEYKALQDKKAYDKAAADRKKAEGR